MDFLKENCMYKMDKYQNLLETESKIIVLSAMSSLRSVVVTPYSLHPYSDSGSTYLSSKNNVYFHCCLINTVCILIVAPHICLIYIVCILTVATPICLPNIVCILIVAPPIRPIIIVCVLTVSHEHNLYSDNWSTYLSHKHNVYADSGWLTYSDSVSTYLFRNIQLTWVR